MMNETVRHGLEGIFEERAEHLSKENLLAWTADFPHDSFVLNKLMGTGAKLLIGPRGCGKSTLLRRAYYTLLETRSALPIYVNYSKSLALEPLFHRTANALQWFQQWVLMKIVLGLSATFTDSSRPVPDDLAAEAGTALKLIEALERGDYTSASDTAMAPSRLAARLEQLSKKFGYSRCVLLMDDAAHAFSPEQQKVFFEIFRELRSHTVAPKAAVYPGITEYSPHFHVGHEGELLEAWANVDDPRYLTSTREIVQRRLPRKLASALEGSGDIVDALSYASFGLPRGFLNMLGHLLLGGDDSPIQNASWTRARDAVRANVDSTRAVFLTLAKKLKRYRRFIEMGAEMETAMCEHLRRYNSEKPISEKAVTIGVKEPLSNELTKVTSFLEYAGLIRKSSAPVSRGEKGRFQRYTLHYSVVVAENVLSLGKRATASSTAEALSHRDAHAFPKLQPATLLGSDFDSKCALDLSPCTECGTPRLTQESRFCHSCGAELIESSIYEEALDASVDELPITERKKNDLKSHSLRKVKQILLVEGSTLRNIRGIGPVWAARIKNAAEEHASV